MKPRCSQLHAIPPELGSSNKPQRLPARPMQRPSRIGRRLKAIWKHFCKRLAVTFKRQKRPRNWPKPDERASETERRLGSLRQQLEADDAVRRKAALIEAELKSARTSADKWAKLSGLIGSADGKTFRLAAQSLTFALLLHEANVILSRMQRPLSADSGRFAKTRSCSPRLGTRGARADLL